MHLFRSLLSRQDGGPSTENPQQPGEQPGQPLDSSNAGNAHTAVIIVVSIAAVFAVIIAFYTIRITRIKHKDPKYIPTPFLKNLWKKWDPSPSNYRLPDTNEHLEPISGARQTGLQPSSGDASAGNSVGTANNPTGTTGLGVDRNTSVRSVMTLPAYNPSASHNEQVLGREGERGGIDVVIEFPETVDEEEQRREDEMEALYQVRVARRRENEEREERRRLRREARQRGDYVALREIQERARASSNASAGQTVEELRAEHERIKKERQRAVSSVSYADLGIARHDGTRLRANSQDSERQGLLGDAASIAASSQYHRRDRSASSILSIDTMESGMPSPGLTRSRANSRADSPSERRSEQVETTSITNEGRAGSSPELIEHEDIPLNSPPEYENITLDGPQSENSNHPEPPPDYSSPLLERAPTFRASITDTSEVNTDERRNSRRTSSTHIGQLISSRRESSSGSGSTISGSRTPTGERRASRGVGGAPQLPSLRLTTLPSIQVDPASPSPSPSPMPRPGTVQEGAHEVVPDGQEQR